MKIKAMVRQSKKRWTAALSWILVVTVGACSAATDPGVQSPGPVGSGVDPRVGLEAGWRDAGQAARNLELVAHETQPEGFFNPAQVADFAFANSDLAFRGNLVFQGNYNGFQVWDVSDPSDPELRTSFICPGGQGDLSVYGDLLFMSVEQTRGRVDCGTQGVQEPASDERFRGVRIFDISDLDNPRQIAAVQTCRGSHTHTLLKDPQDDENLYVYVQGTGPVRPVAELEGCSGLPPEEDPNTSLFRIEIIQVPLDAPQSARIINKPRIFADPETGDIAGLYEGGDQTAQTNACHDITTYPAIGRAAGACSGNGILLDITDPANPVRIDEVFDPNFAYWHSATFDNEGSKVIFTDELGGGAQARCQATDRPEWGADAIFTLDDGELNHVSYYKIPAPQTPFENCVAHNGSLIPVPGRDIMVQSWYQGGVSVFDFTDPENPVEIAFFDRGPLSPDELILGGYWSAYWYNGAIYGSEIGRGLDVFRLEPSEYLSENELAAARLVEYELFNPQHQTKVVWPASFVVARAYVDQIERNDWLPQDRIARIRSELDRAEQLAGGPQRRAALTQLATRLEADARGAGDPDRVRALAAAVEDLANAQR
jgi:hypothetical protein